MKTALSKAAEAKHPWGFVVVPNVVDLGRGWARFLLVVYPPGTSIAERKALNFTRHWPLWGAVGALAAEMLLGSIGQATTVTIAIVAVYLGGIAVGRSLTRRIRRDVRRVAVAVTTVGGSRRSFGDAALYRRSVAALDKLDRGLRDGSLTPVQHEAGWAVVYNELESEIPVRVYRSPVE